ncbi:MAG TPA: DUF4214 domain-containing protein [Pseudomonas sp.]|jgi:hypothetical protein|uniref:DUF4214 domain-containing protein n=1 Tax=Pseudomonas sp. TaxID=306 RepID=UPI002EDA4AA6
MSNITYSRPVSTYNISDWDYGSLTSSSVTHFQLSDGVHTTDANGIFVYNNATGLAGGTITGMSWTEAGAPVLSISGINLNVQQLLAGTISVQEKLFDGDDNITGSYGSEGFSTGAGNDNIDGAGDIDTIYYSGGKSDVSVATNGAGYKVSANGKVDTLINVERVGMGDGSILALDVKAGEHAGSAYRLYQAAFDRKPDAAGLNYWTHDLDAGNNIQQVAKGFVDSAEFKALNPANDQNSLINNFYLHVLHRDADAAGLQYWNAEMSSGMTASQVLVSFSESQENINNTAPALDTGVWLV